MGVPLIDLRSLARALGGEVQGRQVVCPGPNHSRIDRSLGVCLSSSSPVGFVVNSYAGDDFAACRDFVLQKLGMPLNAWRTKGSGTPRPTLTFTARELDPAPDDGARIARAVAIWEGASDAHGSVVEVYLHSRGLVLPSGAAAVLRFHPQCPWGDKATGQRIRVPAMVAAMRQIDGDAITAVHRTRLTPEGVKVDRMMLGKAFGAVVKLDTDATVTMGLAIGEGIETVMAGRQLGFRPGWALGSAGAISTFPVLGGIDALTILAESDATNARAVERCAARWHEVGREVIVVEPASGSDILDAMQGVA